MYIIMRRYNTPRGRCLTNGRRQKHKKKNKNKKRSVTTTTIETVDHRWDVMMVIVER